MRKKHFFIVLSAQVLQEYIIEPKDGGSVDRMTNCTNCHDLQVVVKKQNLRL